MKYLSTGEVAERLGVDSEKVIAWIKRGEMSIDDTAVVNLAERANGKKPRFKVREDALETFLRRRAAQPGKPGRRPRAPSIPREFF